MTEKTRPACLSCKGRFEPVDILRRASSYSTNIDSGTAPCPHCGTCIEFRLRGGKLELGYSYWAGSMHFEGMETYPVRGLKRVRDGEKVCAVLDGETFVLNPGHPAP